MKRWFYMLPIALLCLLSACKESGEVGRYDDWKKRNQNFLDSLETVFAQQTPDAEGRVLKRFNLITEPDEFIYYKVLDPTTDVDPKGGYEYLTGYKRENVKPTGTDQVAVYYRGTLINGDYFDGFEGENPSVADAPLLTYVDSNIILGWKETLQHMEVGERWLVYLPHIYGYGSIDKAGIPAYSLLIFDMQLFEIVDK